MCGIVGYIGKRKAYPILIKGLKRLEYRGYDSAGVAIISDDQQLNVYKTKGKVSDLENFVTQKDISGTIGIAHTRWATHGEPCSANAHPHYSSSEKLALIHNGIIENYAVLKEKLQAKGYIFKSSTDTEVLVQLIEYLQYRSASYGYCRHRLLHKYRYPVCLSAIGPTRHKCVPQAGRKDCYRIGGSLVSGVTNGHKYRYNVPSMNTRNYPYGCEGRTEDFLERSTQWRMYPCIH